MRSQFGFSIGLALLTGWFGVGCSPESTPPPAPAPVVKARPTAVAGPKAYPAKGVVLELLPDGKSARIRHEEIPGYMQAMTMPFRVKDPKDLAGVKPADIVTFRLNVTEDEGWIDQIKVVGQEEKVTAIPHVRVVRDVEPLKVGDTLPDYPFTNQVGKAFHTADFKGQALAITFIFTRCPFPDFCPRMSKNFAEVQRLLSSNTSAPGNWHLLSLSFDPEHDTPGRLRGYGKDYKADFKTWTFASGAIIEIDDITERFGLEFARDESGVNFNHKLRTVVLDARGRVYHVFVGNEWTPADLAEKIIEAAKVPVEDGPGTK